MFTPELRPIADPPEITIRQACHEPPWHGDADLEPVHDEWPDEIESHECERLDRQAYVGSRRVA